MLYGEIMLFIVRIIWKPSTQNAEVLVLNGARGGAVVEALPYKPEGRGIDSRLCHWKFSVT
jgi:hypothetical protein